MSWIITTINWLGVLNRGLIQLFKYLVLSAVAVMTLVILIQVFFRYVLDNSLPWSEELARYLMVWMTFLALPVVSRNHQHAALEIVLGALPRWSQSLLRLVLYAMVGAVLYFAFDKSLDFAMKGTRMLATALPISKAWSYSAMPIGFAATFIVYAELFARDLVHLIAPDKLAPSTNMAHQ